MLENHLVVFSEELAKKISVYFNFINATQQRKVYKDLCDKWSKEYIAETHKWVVLVHIVFLAYNIILYNYTYNIMYNKKRMQISMWPLMLWFNGYTFMMDKKCTINKYPFWKSTVFCWFMAYPADLLQNALRHFMYNGI